MRVDGEIHLRQPREMPHGLQFRHLRQRRRRGAAQVRGHWAEPTARGGN